MSFVSRQILLFARGDGLQREFNRIRHTQSILIKPGLFFKRLGEYIYQVNPDQPGDYINLFKSLEPACGVQADIFHLWNLECDGVDYLYGDLPKTLRSLRQNLATGPQSVVRIGHALARPSWDGDIRVLYAHYGREAHPQPQNDIAPDLHKAGNGVFLKKLRFQERPTDMAALAPVIDRELAGAGAAGSVEVGYTGAFVRTVDAPRCANGVREFAALPFRRRGCYWVTDNSNGWGAAIADYLKKRLACDVTLIGGDHGVDARALLEVPVVKGPNTLNGIVHCLEDDDLRSVPHNLEATLALDHASMETKLDFFALVTAPGSGREREQTFRERTFADGFVALRKKLCSMGKRQGETRSFHWNGSGLDSLSTAFSRSAEPVLNGEGPRTARPSAALVKANQPIREQDVVRIIADTLKLETREVDLDASADSGRFNSMLLAAFVGRLNKRFGISLTPPLFYEHKTLRSFIRFLIDRYGDGTKEQFAEAAPQTSPPIKAVQAVSARGARDVAIVGISGVFPGSPDVGAFWRNLANGHDLIREIPAARWDWRASAGNSDGPRLTSRWGGFVDDIDAFDAPFFGISRREAEMMDPQQRLLMEAAWKAIEDAGHRPSSLAGSRTGVFIGATTHDYYDLLVQSGHWDSHLGTGTSQSILSNRLSWLLDLCGPSETIDTACSSSLVAVCRAITALEAGECDAALAGGVNALLSPTLFVALTRAGMLSEDGRCKAFSSNANGYVRGEGVGVVWLRPLEQALADRDHVYAVIKGGAVNHGGRVSSLTVPSPEAQAAAIIRCYEKANVDPSTIGYVEAHGSGTALGDPIEINGVKKDFEHLSARWPDNSGPGERSCGIGTVKSNIGHLESAAGIAGVLKVVLALKNRMLPASLHCGSVNSYIDLQGSPFYIVNKPVEWHEPANGGLRRAGVSSFGFGGVNAHVLLEEAPRSDRSLAPRHFTGTADPALVVLSAKSEDRLMACATDLLAFLNAEEGTESSLADLAYTLQIGRDSHYERLALLVDSLADLREKLNRFVSGAEEIENVYRGQVQRNDETIAVIGRDEDMQRAVDDWVRKRKYSDLLRLWIRGLAVDWDKLYGEDKPRRISLPTYPFARERYWIPEADPVESLPRRKPESASISDPEWFSLVEAWIPSALEIEPDRWVEKIEAKKHHAILVLSEQSSDFEAMQAFCRELSRVARRDSALWQIDFHQFAGAHQNADFEQLLSAGDRPVAAFLLLQPIVPGEELRELERVYTCVQSLVHHAAARPVQFYCCYRDDPTDRSLYREALSGLFKSAMLETADHRYRSISYDADSPGKETLPACLIKEWLWDGTGAASPERVPMVRYDGGGRSELQVNESRAHKASIRPGGFRKGATYLIAGGLGEASELVCRELGRRFQSRLIIFGRRSEGAATEVLARVRASGAQVVYRSVDVLDTVGLRREMRALKESGEVIHGVIHAARRVVDQPIVRKSFREFSEVMAAKVQGTLNIEAVTADEPLEFFIAFSSVASFGIKGSADYAYSTAFQNALARRRNVPGAPLCFRAFCWGQFERDGGVRPDRLLDRLAQLHGLGIRPIDAASSIAAMETGLSQGSAVVGFVAVHDKARFRRAMGFDPVPGDKGRTILEAVDAFERGESGDGQFAEFLKTLNTEDYTETVRKRVIEALRRSERGGRVEDQRGSPVPTRIAEHLAEHLAKVLKIMPEMLDHARPFQEYGLDSITAMQLSSRLEKEFQIAIQPHWLIEYPCITSFAGKLTNELVS